MIKGQVHRLVRPGSPQVRFLLRPNCSGQALTEIIVAIGIAALFMMAATFTITAVLKSNNTNRNLQTATNLATEIMDKAKSLADSKWHGIYDLNRGSSEHYYIVASSSTRSSADSVNDGLVALWKFDEGAGGTTTDSSGNGYTGTLMPALNPPLWISGQVGQALNFDGNEDYVGMANGSYFSFETSTPFTLSSWIKREATDTFDPIFGKFSSDSLYTGYALQIVNSYLDFDLINNNSNGPNTNRIRVTTPAGSIQNGQWYHVAATYDGSSLASGVKIYIDGVSSPLTVLTDNLTKSIINTNPLQIGADPSDTPDFFGGIIDEARVYNRVLNPSEIQTIANSSALPVHFFTVISGEESFDISGSNFIRYFYVENVNRDANGNIVSSGGTEDPSTQKITVTVTWPGTTTGISFSEYVTRTGSSVFRQTDWSGGDGQEGPITTVNDKFATSSDIGYLSGAISVASPGASTSPWTVTSTVPGLSDNFMSAMAVDLFGGYIYLAGYEQASASDYNWRIEKRNLSDGSLVSGFGNGGVATSTGPGTRSDKANYLAIDPASGYMYVAGYSYYLTDAYDWRVEKRNLGDGSFVSGFGNEGFVTSTGQGYHNDQAKGIALDLVNGFMYLSGYSIYDADYSDVRVEKRNLSDGSLVSGFGNGGVATSTSPGSFDDDMRKIVIDSSNSYLYGVGYEQNAAENYNWRIEKRNASDGSFVSGFGSGGIVTSTGYGYGDDDAYYIVIEPAGAYMYVVGYEQDSASDYNWRIEKRSLSVGDLIVGFGSGGVVTSTSAGADRDGAKSIAIDSVSGFMYVAGYESDPDYNWRIEKRNLSDGSLVSGFGNGGVATSTGPGSGSDSAQSIAIDTAGGYMYVSGYSYYPSTGSRVWQIEKRLLSDGTLVSFPGVSAGILISSVFDSGVFSGATFNSVGWQGDQPSGTSVQFQIATSNNSAGPWNYVGPDGASGSYYSPAGPGIFTPISYQYHSNQRYIRYMAFLNVNGSSTPQINDILIGWSP